MFERLYVIVVLAKLSVRDMNEDDFFSGGGGSTYTSEAHECVGVVRGFSSFYFLSQDD